MDRNPYEPPSAPLEVTGVNRGTREELKKVAQYQKGVLFCILFQILGGIGQIVVPEELAVFFGLSVFVVAIAGMVFVFLLAINVYSTGTGILLGILSLLPLIGLIVLLVVNGKATGILKENGVRVGLLGANLSQV